MDDATIRSATAQDALAVGALALQLGRELGHAAEPGFLDRYADAWRRALDHRPTWLAELPDGRPVGALVTARVDKLPGLGRDTTSWLHVSSLFVAADVRGAGLGERLLREMLTWAREHRVERVQLNSLPAARSLYLRVGFTAPDQRLLELRL